MNIFTGKRKIISSISYPLFFSALFLIVISSLSLINIDAFSETYNELQNAIGILYSVLFGGFIAFYETENAKKAVCSAFCLAVSNLIFFLNTGISYSIVFIIILCVAFAKVVCNMELEYAFVSMLFIAVAVAFVISFSYDWLYELLRNFCGKISGKGALFGVINNVYSIFVSNTFEDMFYYKEYSSSILINGKLSAGAVNIFSSDVLSPKTVVAKYLTGKYFVNIFATLGILLSLYSRFNNELKYAFVSVCVLAIVFGDVRLLSVYILLYNPFIYLGYLAVIFVSYIACAFIDIRIGFFNDGSVFELFKYGRQWAYFIITGVVIAVLMYFVNRLVLSRFDFDTHRFLPRDVKNLVNALGGEDNIKKIDGGHLYVVNANLINILKVDCDIHENEVTLIQDDFDLLQDYF
jgi:hypothetical protein